MLPKTVYIQKQLDFYSKKKVSLWTYRKFLFSDQYQDAHTLQKGAEKYKLGPYLYPKSVFLFWGAPKMCFSQNDGHFFKSDIAILGVLFMRDLEPGNYLFPLHDNHVMFHSGLITVICVSSFFILINNLIIAKLNFVSI